MTRTTEVVERADPKVSVIIVNWNGKVYLKDCLTSVLSQTYPNYEVILVDNGSTDGSVSLIKESFPEIRLIRLDRNYGFAKANNIGIEEALEDKLTEYVALLNNDAYVDRRWLEELVTCAEKSENVGMVASKILFAGLNTINSVGTIVLKDGSAAHLGGKETDRGQYDLIKETFAPCAAAALYARRMLEDIGSFDEDFFAYMEDVDLGWRARLAGWKCTLAPNARAYHKHSATSKKHSEFKIYQIERNRVYLVVKNFPPKYAFASSFHSLHRLIVMYTFRESVRTEVSRYFENVPISRIMRALLKAWFDALLSLKKCVRKRKIIQSRKRVSTKAIDKWFLTFSKPIHEVASR